MWETDTNNTNKVLLTGQIRWEPELAKTLSSAGCEDISSTARRSRHRIAQGRSEPQSPEQNLPAAWGCGCAPRGESQNTPWQCEPAKSLQSCQLFATAWTAVCKASLSMGFSRQEYWSGLPCPPPGDLPNPGIEPISLMSLALAGEFFTTSASPRSSL